MKYFSTNGSAQSVTFKQAVFEGLAKDKGLFFPEHLPRIGLSDDELRQMPFLELALHIMRPYVGNDLDEEQLKWVLAETLNFELPLVPINTRISCLELFHGPTLAFKDVGARFMSRCLSQFAKDFTQKTIVLVATSGDTGGAVANGFFKVEGVEVLILYPKGRVSPAQEAQLTSLGHNIHALEVEGSFDDCQALVKQAFNDNKLRENCFLTSANSINVARWLPQQLYFFKAYQQLASSLPLKPYVCVPSGNFGNICAGLLAQKTGLPLGKFIAACNANDTIPRFMQNQHYQPNQTISTLSNAMDVSNPSNFVRIQQLFDNDFGLLKSHLSCTTITDNETSETIRAVYNLQQYTLCPHTAVAYKALSKTLENEPAEQTGFILGTAHPAKFNETMTEILNQEISIPPALQNLEHKKINTETIEVDYSKLVKKLKAL